MVSSRKKILSFAITALGLLALFLVAVNTGSLKVMPLELFKGLFIEYNENVATIYDLRFPRILIAIFGGAATAVSGVLLQAVMKNPLADPGIIGVSSGASLTAVLITAFERLRHGGDAGKLALQLLTARRIQLHIQQVSHLRQILAPVWLCGHGLLLSTRTGAAIVEVEQKNDEQVGSLLLTKKGEQLTEVTGDSVLAKVKALVSKVRNAVSGKEETGIYKDFKYEETGVEGAQFEVYAKDTIYSPDGAKDEEGNPVVRYVKARNTRPWSG